MRQPDGETMRMGCTPVAAVVPGHCVTVTHCAQCSVDGGFARLLSVSLLFTTKLLGCGALGCAHGRCAV